MRLVASVPIAAPPDRVTDLVRSVDLHERTSTPIRGRAVDGRTAGLAEPGDRTTWAATFFGVRARVTVETVAVETGRRVEERLAGGRLDRFPLAAFGHTYRVDRRPGGCVLWDTFTVRLVGGPLGEVATRGLLRRTMAALVRHRLDALRRVAEGEAWREVVLRDLVDPDPDPPPVPLPAGEGT